LLSSHYHDSLAEQTDLQGIRILRADTNEDGKPVYTFSEGVDEGGYAVRSAIQAGLPDQVTKRLGIPKAEVSRLKRISDGIEPHPMRI